MEVDRTNSRRIVTFKTSCGTQVAIFISAEWLWNYLKDFHSLLSLRLLKEGVIPKIMEFCHHYLVEPIMVDHIPLLDHGGNHHHHSGSSMYHNVVQPWYKRFVLSLNHPDVRRELRIASRILHIQPLDDLIGATSYLPFPHHHHYDKNNNMDYCKSNWGDLRAGTFFVESTGSSSQRQKRKRMEVECGGGSRKR